MKDNNLTNYTHDGLGCGGRSFEELASKILSSHSELQKSALESVNRYQTMCYWLIGYYIVEFEKYGKNKTLFGNNLIDYLEKRLNVKNITSSMLRSAKKLYLYYPQIADCFEGQDFSMLQDSDSPALQIRQPMTFEFLGLKAQDIVDENDLEDALISHLQEFMMELGKGFCFESRQQRIVIDDEYFYPDLVFYNRMLHCNVIIELKNEEFSYQNFGQLNAYVSYYKENEMQPGDNPPIGILLCTRKGKKMVEYALAGMDNQLFVSTYMLQLPEKKVLEDFLLKQMKEFGEEL